MTRRRLYQPRGRAYTEAELREISRAVDLPPQPWRFTMTPFLASSLVRVADAAGQMRAIPLSYFRRKELESRAKRKRMLWALSRRERSVTAEDIEAMLSGAVLPGRRRAGSLEGNIASAAIAEDALDQYTSGLSDRRLTAEMAMAYESVSSLRGLDSRHWLRLSPRQRDKLLELHLKGARAPAPVKELFAWADADPFVSQLRVLRAATFFWGLTLLYPAWHGVEVVLHHEFRVADVDPYGLLMLTEESAAQHQLLSTPAPVMGDADDGDLTQYFERFTHALWLVLDERLRQLGRAQADEANLPWELLAPPDALDARIFEVVEQLGHATSTVIRQRMGAKAPPLRTIQRRLQKLVRDGALGKRGARKNASYAVPAAEGR